MASAAAVQTAIEEYLQTAYSPDCDYVDGHVEERHLGEFDHGYIQSLLDRWFGQHELEWKIYSVVELRVRVSPTRVRIPDVALISRSAPREQVITHPPLAVIEVLSPQDRVSQYTQRLRNYREMGVKHIWVIDPEDRRGYDCSTADWIEKVEFAVKGTPITLSLETLFSQLENS